MVEPIFGLTFTRGNEEPLAVIASDMSTIAIVGTAPGAEAGAFPLDRAVQVRTSDLDLRGRLGTTGTIPDAIRGIADQLGEFQAAMDLIIVRVADAADVATQMAYLIGAEASLTGIYALLAAGTDLAKIPRIVVVPGFTHQLLTGVQRGAITPGSGGTNGTFGIATTGGTGAGLTGTFTVTGGALTSVDIVNPGVYTVPPTLSFAASAGLTGAAAPLTLAPAANPVCSALPSVLNRLLAHAVVEGPGTTEIAAKNWREGINSDRLIPIDMWVKVLEGASIVSRPGAPRFAGMLAAVDYEHGGAPMHSAANRPIQGITGLVRSIGFSLTDGATEAQSLLAANIGVAVRGELGVESAISTSGFIAIATDTAGDDPNWQFYNTTRGRDYIHLGLMRALRTYLGRVNITGHAVQAVLNTATIWLTQLQADGNLLGFRVGFSEDQNTPEDLRLGRFSFDFQAEEPPVLRRIDMTSRKYRPALSALVQELLEQTSPVAPTAS